jgi:hypothetical protein
MKTGKIMDSVGYNGASGYTMSNKKYYAMLKRNGYKVKQTKDGVFITKKGGAK